MKLQRLLLITGIYPPDIGGPATYAKVLMEELPARGIEPALVVFSPLMRYPRLLRHLLFLREILATQGPFDVLFALDTVSSGLPALLASIVMRRPLVLRVGGSFAWEQASERFAINTPLDRFTGARVGLSVSLLAGLERFVVRNARKVIVPSRYLKSVLLRWGVRNERIEIVPNGVMPIEADASRAQARAVLGVRGRLIVSVGRLVRGKGFGEVVKAVGELATDFQDVSLVIIGDGPRYVNIANLIEAARLEERVHLPGALPHSQTLQYLRAGDIFVLNSAGEGQSYALLEAMAARTPVIATDVSGNLELIEHGRTGWLVPHHDRRALVEAISTLLQDDMLASRLASEARRRVKEFSVERMLEGTISALGLTV